MRKNQLLTRVALPALVGAALLQWAAAPDALAPVDAPTPFDPATLDTTSVLVDVADDLDADARAAFIATLPGAPELNSVYSADEGLYRLDVASGEAASLIARLSSDSRVEFVERDAIYTLHDGLETASFDGAGDVTPSRPAPPTQPNDPLYPFQWHLDQIDVESAWSSATGQGVVVAVIDTGVAFDDAGRFRRVQDLAADRFTAGYDFVSDDDAPYDEHGHGTHVAGTIAQTTNNGYGVAGVAPRARIMPIRVLDASGRGNTADIAESIRWAADNGADVINMSLGGPVPSRIMRDAIRYAHRRGVTVIAAAGNSGWSLPSFPAAYGNVLAVSATQYDRTTTFYSNYGAYVGIAAPGGNVRVDQNNDGRPDGVMQETLVRGNPGKHEFALYMGTSMAAPHVAGVAALVHQAGVTKPDQVAAILQQTASQDVPTYERGRYGAGIVNAGAAASAATTRFAVPRTVLGVALAFFALASTRRRGNARPVSASATLVGAGLGAGGLAVVIALAGAFGAPVAWAASLAQPVFAWPCAASTCGLLAVVAASAIPAFLLYAFAGGGAAPRRAGLVCGIALGAAAWMGAEAFVSTRDILGVPGAGFLDSLWLIGNAAVAAWIGFFGLRARTGDAA